MTRKTNTVSSCRNRKASSSLDVLNLIPDYSPFETKEDCWFDEEAAERAVCFFREHLKFFEGSCAGKPFEPQPWQEAILRNLFGWKRPDGTRRYREAYIQVARKNGKTPLCAGIVNYVAFCDREPGAQIYSTAGEREQAALIFRHAAGMISQNPELMSRARIYRSLKCIEYYGGAVFYKALSAEAKTKHGLNVHLVINDELHVQPNRELVDTLETATASRRQPLIVHITTAGYDRHTICWEKYDYACKVRDGIIQNVSFLPVIYECKPEEDWEKEENWKKANPNLGISVSIDYLREKCREAKEIPAKENLFRRLHLNQWTTQESRWLPMHCWEQCREEYQPADLAGKTCWAGLDLSITTDLTSLALFFPDSGRVLSYNWAPREGAEKRMRRDKVPYLDWAKDGWLECTPGTVVDYDRIRKRLNELRQQYNIQVLAVDRWNASQLIQQLEGDGFKIVKIGQGYASMTAPTKELEKMILQRALKHNGNPILSWAMSNVSVEQDAAGNLKPSKEKSTERIDPVVALINALAVYLVQPATKTSIYEQRGFLVL